MRVWNRIVIGGLSVLSLAACAVSAPTVTVVNQELVHAGTKYTTARVSENGRGTAYVSIKRAADKALLGLSHRWTAENVFEYRFALEAADANGNYQALTPPVGLTVSNKNPYPAAAAFTGLEAGKKYRLSLQAWGNTDGTAATDQMNTATSSTAVIDLTAANDLETQHQVNMQVVLDPQTFTADAEVTIEPPADAEPTTDPSASPSDEPSPDPSATPPAPSASLTWENDSYSGPNLSGFWDYADNANSADSDSDAHLKLTLSDLPAGSTISNIDLTILSTNSIAHSNAVSAAMNQRFLGVFDEALAKQDLRLGALAASGTVTLHLFVNPDAFAVGQRDLQQGVPVNLLVNTSAGAIVLANVIP